MEDKISGDNVSKLFILLDVRFWLGILRESASGHTLVTCSSKITIKPHVPQTSNLSKPLVNQRQQQKSRT